MPAIYISYRKEDTQGSAAHLYKNLAEAFGRQAVFMDVAGSQPGRDVRDVVDDHLVSCAAVLVIIGKAWADARDESGQRRLDNPLDLVRIETAAALKLDRPVIPVLVHGATMVQPAELPPELADLAFRNPVTLLQSQWGSDVETLVTLLRSLMQGQVPGDAPVAAAEPAADTANTPRARLARPRPVGQLPWRTMLAAVVGVGVLALGVYAFMVSRQPAGKAAAPAQDTAATVAKADGTVTPAQAVKDPEVPQAVPDTKTAPPPVAAPVVRDTAPAASRAEAPKPALPAPAAAAPAKPPVAAVPVPATPPPAAAVDAVKPGLPPLASASAKVLTFQKWTLNSGGCGAGPVTVTGTARFSVEKTSDAIVVTEEFRGSGSGYEVVVSGQVEFSREQPSYEIPTAGQWTGPKVFKTAGIDRVNTSDGVTPSGASVVKFQSLCG